MKSRWLKTLFARIGDLIIKALGIKVVVATVLTVVLANNPELGAMPGFWIVLLMWIVIFGLRDFKEAKKAAAGILPQRGTE